MQFDLLPDIDGPCSALRNRNERAVRYLLADSGTNDDYKDLAMAVLQGWPQPIIQRLTTKVLHLPESHSFGKKRKPQLFST